MAEYVGTKDGGKDLATQEDITGGGGAPLSNDAPDALTPDQAGAAGTSSSAARADHSHQIDTAAPASNLTAGTTNAEGSATTFARSDHSHAISVGTPGTIQPDHTASAGSSTNLARADHRHAIAADAASTITGTNTEGTSTSFARADHNHQLGASVVGTSQIADGAVTGAKLTSGSVTVSVTAPSSPRVGDLWFNSDAGKLYIYYDSFWVNPASLGLREDGISTAAATKLTYTNAAGSASTLARSDHDHAIKAVGAFSAHIGGGNQTLTNNANSVLAFNTEDYDLDNWYSTSTFRYTPQKEGYYHLGTFLLFDTPASNYYDVALGRNGAWHRQLDLFDSSHAYPRGSSSTIVYANGTTDYFDIQVYVSSNGNEAAYGVTANNAACCRFWGYYLGSA